MTEANNQSRRLAAAHAQLVRQVETIELLRADLAELASRDALTGLHNRRHLVEEFASMITAAEQNHEPLAVALFDVDRFKSIRNLVRLHEPHTTIATRFCQGTLPVAEQPMH